MAARTTEVSVRDPRDPRPAGGARAGAVPQAVDDPIGLRRPSARPAARAAVAGGHGSGAHGRGAGTPSRPDPTGARLAAGMAGAAATTAILAAIVGGATGAAAPPADAATAATQPVAEVPVRHVTQVVHIPSDATPPPRKVVQATPVPAPVKPRVVVVTTTQSGTVIR